MDEIPFQLLRIPPGWRIDWNTLFEVEPSAGWVIVSFDNAVTAASIDLYESYSVGCVTRGEWRIEECPLIHHSEFAIRILEFFSSLKRYFLYFSSVGSSG